MARPLFIICAENCSEDKEGGLLSLFSVIEGITATQIPKPEVGTPIVVQSSRLVAVAVWMREEGDGPDIEFEHQMWFYVPGTDEPACTEPRRFRFDQWFYRIKVRNTGLIGFSAPGMFRIESKIRRVGTETWLIQDYLIPVKISGSPAPDE